MMLRFALTVLLLAPTMARADTPCPAVSHGKTVIAEFQDGSGAWISGSGEHGARIEFRDRQGRVVAGQQTTGGAFLRVASDPSGEVTLRIERTPDPATALPLTKTSMPEFDMIARRPGQTDFSYRQIVRVVMDGELALEQGCSYRFLLIEYHIPEYDVRTYALNIPALRLNASSGDTREKALNAPRITGVKLLHH